MSRLLRLAGFALAVSLVLVACQYGEETADETASYTADSTTATPATRGGPEVKAKDFTLVDTDGQEHTLADYLADGKTVVLEWFNPDCPYTRAYHTPERRMSDMAGDLEGRNVVWLAINSGAPGKQGAGLDRNKQACSDWDIGYPVLLDESGTVGSAYGAKTTPHMFIVTPDGGLVYDGAIDDSKGRGEATTNYVLQAIKEHRSGRAITVGKTKPFGCSVKYAN